MATKTNSKTKTVYVFDLEKYIADCERRGFTKKDIRENVKKWAGKCNGLTVGEIGNRYGYVIVVNDWCREVVYSHGQELDQALLKFLKAKGYRPRLKEKYVANLQKELLKSGKVLVYSETPVILSGLAMSIRYKFDIISFEEIKSLIPDGSKIVGLIKIEIRNEDEVVKQ